MSGLRKQKEYDWKDSNLANFGSDEEKKVKKDSAATEPAWEGAGAEVGLQIWRIEKFQVAHWPKEEYGNFFNGDSYIILNTYQDEGEDEIKYDVHFWIGKYSSQDEYGTAAYKTVELDTLLDDKPVQHREVMGHESSLFLSYFADSSYTVMKGGVDTGFNRVLPAAYNPRLFHIKREKGAKGKWVKTCKEVAMKKSNLNSGDVFIIDAGEKIYQWNGAECSHFEKNMAAAKMDELEATRKCETKILEENSTSASHPAMMLLRDGGKKDKAPPAKGERKIIKVSDAEGGGIVKLTEVEGSYSLADLTRDDVFLVSTEDHMFCWVGQGASVDERRNAIPYACNYLAKETETPWLPITVVAEGKEKDNEAFMAIQWD